LKYFAVILLFISIAANAQFGEFQALELPTGARSAALGGTMVSLGDGDITQFMNNPAVLDSVRIQDIAVNYNPYFGGINVFSGSYCGNFGAAGPVAIGLTYLNYGEFTETDATGAKIGQFRASDYVIAIGKSHHAGAFSLGMNMKLAHSSIESYGATALVFDIGGIYRVPEGNVSVGLAFKNFGVKLSEYYANGNSSLPFDVQMGVSVKPEHMPFRFTITAYNLIEQNLVFKPESADKQSSTSAAADHIFRRINLGTELILNRSLQFQLGYNHLRRKELSVGDIGAGAGFSYGLSLKVKRMSFSFARATYHAAGGANFIALKTNINSYKNIL
jgi:hypothetical protein